MATKHIEVLDKKITALSKALANLGRGTTAKELLLIIRKPGWTTPAELKFATGMINAINDHVSAIETLQKDLLSASKAVGKQR